jgi:hypothetical protein
MKKFDKVDLIPAGYSSEEDEEETYRSEKYIPREASPSVISPLISGRNPKKNESSIIETDISVLAINKKIEEMRREQERKKLDMRKNVSN